MQPRVVVLGILMWVSACSSPSEAPPPAPAIAISSAVQSIAILQGESQTVDIAVTRTNYTGSITFVVEGLPGGVTGQFATVSDASVRLSILATATATPGTTTLTIRATAVGLAERALTASLTVNVKGDYALGAPAPASVEQGGAGSFTVAVNRSGGFAGTVSFGVTGAPTGLTVTAPSPSTSGNASFTMTAGAATPPGSHTLTITGSTAGLSNQTASVTVNVLQITPVSWTFCSTDGVVWLARQNEGGSWTRITPTGNTFAFGATQKVATAVTREISPNVFSTIVLQSSAAELVEIASLGCAQSTGTRTVSATVSGLSGEQFATVAMSGQSQVATVASPSVTLSGLPDGALDAVAVRGLVTTPAGSFPKDVPSAVIIRRGQTVASGGSLAAIDFNAAEAVAPVANTLTIAGSNVGTGMISSHFVSAAGARVKLSRDSVPSSTSRPLYSIAASQLHQGDLHEVRASVATSGWEYGAVLYYHAPGDKTVTTGTFLSNNLCTSNSSTPYFLFECELASNTLYNSLATFTVEQQSSGRSITLGVTRAYLGQLPAQWRASLPNFTGVTGFNVDWMLKSGAIVVKHLAGSGRAALQFGARPVDGDAISYEKIRGAWSVP